MDRKISISKNNLIAKLKENKKNHIDEYEKAVVAYKKEALKQLAELKTKVEGGVLDISLELVTPVNVSNKYDDIIKMFEWELNDVVDLTKSEFDEYVLDKFHFSITAKFSNQTYLSR